MGSRSHQSNITLRSFIASVLFLPAAILAQEQFLFDDPLGNTISTGSTPDGETQFEIHGALAVVEGDIVIGNAFDLMRGAEKPRYQTRGLARKTQLDRWPNGIVYYEIGSEVASEEIQKVQDAVAHWNEKTTLKFIQRTPANADTIENYIHILPAEGCGSYVGYVGRAQELWINPNCTTGSIIHEIGHAVGLFHEHTRADRDNYITVLWENIPESKQFNFDIMDDGVEVIYDYDYGSIMHYGTTFFSSNGEPTIEAPDGISIGQREALSVGDITTVDALYATDLSLSETATPLDGDTIQVDVQITNLGRLGANTIQYILPLRTGDNGASYLGQDWSCVNQGDSLNCEKEVLESGTDTTLALRYNRAVPDSNPLAGYVASKTLDTDLSNNGAVPSLNPDTQPALEIEPLPIPDPNPPEQEEPELQPEPTLETEPTPEPDPAVEPAVTPEPTIAEANEHPTVSIESGDSAGGGSLGLVFLGWLLVWLVARELIPAFFRLR